MNILVVDDHPLVREALRAVSFDLGSNSNLYEAGDSRQARQLIRKHKDVRLVLLDLRLPDGDGFGLLSELRESIQTSPSWSCQVWTTQPAS